MASKLKLSGRLLLLVGLLVSGVLMGETTPLIAGSDCQGWSCWQQIRNDGTTQVSPAAASYGGKLYVFRTGTDDHLYYATLGNTIWSGWSQVPGQGRTDTEMAATTYGRSLYLFHRFHGDDSGSCFPSCGFPSVASMNVFDGSRWSNPVDVPGSEHIADVAVTTFGNAGSGSKMYLFATKQTADSGNFRRIFLNSGDGSAWGGWEELPGGGLTPSAPSAVTFQGRLYVFVRATNDEIWQNVFDGNGWSNWAPTPGGGLTPSAPSAITHAAELYVFVRGSDDTPYMNAFVPLLNSLDSSTGGLARGCIQADIKVPGTGISIKKFGWPDPDWVSVNAGPESLHSAAGVITEARLTHTDWVGRIPGFPKSSHSDSESLSNADAGTSGHDWDIGISLDPQYRYLMSDENAAGELGVEVESLFLPDFARPWGPLNPGDGTPGDRVFMMGRWIYDCGHPAFDNDGRYHTEIHPTNLLVTFRDEPAPIDGSGNPVQATVARVYLSGRSSMVVNGNGPPDYPMNQGDYEFDIQLPPRPLAGSVPQWLLSGPPADSRGSAVVSISDLVTPQIIPLPAENPTYLHVVLPLASAGVSDPLLSHGAYVKIAAGWNGSSSAKIRKLRVVFHNIHVTNDHDEGTKGEWFLVLGVNGQWCDEGKTGLKDVGGIIDDSDTKSLKCYGQFRTDPVPATFDVDVEEGQTLRIRAVGFECDLSCGGPFHPESLDSDERIGDVIADFNASDNSILGQHETESQDGDYSLTYTIETR